MLLLTPLLLLANAAAQIAGEWVGEQVNANASSGGLPALVGGTVAATQIQRDLGWLLEVADRRKPFSAVTHCLCDGVR